MEFFMGGVEDFQHLAKGGSFYAEEPFELGIAGCQCFLHSFGGDEHCRQIWEKVDLTDNNNVCRIPQYQCPLTDQCRLENRSITEHSRRKVFGKDTSDNGQIDLLLEDGDIAILIEVKTNLKTNDVREHIERLEKYRRCMDKKGNGDKKRYVGAVAAAVAEQNVIEFAQKKGLYVIVQSGDAVKIVTPPKGFKAKTW